MKTAKAFIALAIMTAIICFELFGLKKMDAEKEMIFSICILGFNTIVFYLIAFYLLRMFDII